MRIVVTGSIAYDYLMRFPGRFSDHLVKEQLQNISVSFLVKDMVKRRGGTAPNIAYTVALLGGYPTIMATAGCDFTEYRLFLEKHGVDTSGIVEIDEEYTASFFANTDNEQNQIATFYAGAMNHAGLLSFAEHAPHAEIAIVSPNEPQAMQKYMQECKDLGIPYIYDPSQQTIWLSGDELRQGIDGAYLLTVNEYEFGLIQEKTGLTQEDVLQRAQGLLITRGKRGSSLFIDGQLYEFPVIEPTTFCEPTGAGDAFRAGLLRSIQLGLPWSLAGRVAALCSTYCIEQMGTQLHHFTPEQFIGRLRQHYDDNGQLDALLSVNSFVNAQYLAVG